MIEVDKGNSKLCLVADVYLTAESLLTNLGPQTFHFDNQISSCVASDVLGNRQCRTVTMKDFSTNKDKAPRRFNFVSPDYLPLSQQITAFSLSIRLESGVRGRGP